MLLGFGDGYAFVFGEIHHVIHILIGHIVQCPDVFQRKIVLSRFLFLLAFFVFVLFECFELSLRTFSANLLILRDFFGFFQPFRGVIRARIFVFRFRGLILLKIFVLLMDIFFGHRKFGEAGLALPIYLVYLLLFCISIFFFSSSVNSFEFASVFISFNRVSMYETVLTYASVSINLVSSVLLNLSLNSFKDISSVSTPARTASRCLKNVSCTSFAL